MKLHKCRIPGCNYVFSRGVLGWHKHAGALSSHSTWHPDVTDPVERRKLYMAEHPDFFRATSVRVKPRATTEAPKPRVRAPRAPRGEPPYLRAALDAISKMRTELAEQKRATDKLLNHLANSEARQSDLAYQAEALGRLFEAPARTEANASH